MPKIIKDILDVVGIILAIAFFPITLMILGLAFIGALGWLFGEVTNQAVYNGMPPTDSKK